MRSRMPEGEPKMSEKSEKADKIKKIISVAVIALLIPSAVAIGVFVFGDRAYIWVSLCVALLSCLPFFLRFEHKAEDGRRTAVLAVMTALSVIGRFVFSAIPHFKPVSAVVIITGVYLGPEAGFLCGALSAIVSNIIFGQGPWTPFQMMTWGFIGFIAGIIAPMLKKSKILMLLYGALAGLFFSLVMDIWTVLWDGTFTMSRYLAAVVAAVPVTAVYMVSNVLFLLLLADPIGRKLDRINKKYRL